MPRSAAEKGKQKEDTRAPKEETFSQLLMGDEEEFDGYLQENETLEEVEEEPINELDKEISGDDDDKDSLEEWMPEDDEIIDDSEITDLLNSSTAQRTKLKTGGQDELERDFEEFENNLALTSGIGIKNLSKSAKKRALQGEIRLSDEVKRKLGEANGLYIARDYGAAIDILQGIIRDNSNAHPAWNTLGLVHEELGNKAKSLQLRMVAAHMCNDTSLWKELGQKSIENDALTQAIYCFSKALILDPSDVDALWDRSFLHKQLGRSSDAIAGFTKILELMPHHFKVINELAQLYRVQGKTKEAIKMYEDAIIYHNDHMDDESDDENEDEEDEFSDKLGYSEINMLSELYLILNDYKRALETIKTGLRHVQKRQSETWWVDHKDDDDEYLEDDESRTDFPIELRVRMGVCRVYLNQVRLATRHFQYLLQYPATTYPDLHQDIAYAYYDKRHYNLALTVFQRIIDASSEIEVDLLIRTADCYREVGDLDTAVIFYINVLDEQPENLDVMMSLATVYEEQGKEEEALELVDFVMKKNRELRRLKKADASKGHENNLTPEQKLKRAKEARKAKTKKASIFDENNHQSKAEYNRQRQEEKSRQDEEMAYTVKGLFEKLDELDVHIGKDLVHADRSLIRDYMRSAQELWDDFSSCRSFFPSERRKKFEGFYALRKGKKDKNKRNDDDISLEAHQMANRLRTRVKTEDMDVSVNDIDDEDRDMLEQEEANARIAAASHFRGFTFDQWISVFLKYAYMLAITKRADESHELLKKVYTANVNFHDVGRKTAAKLALIGCGIVDDNEFIAQEGMRWFCNFYQFKNDPFRLYAAVISCGGKDTNSYASYTQMKYLARNIKLLDAIVASVRKRAGGKNTNQPDLDEIKELNDAILAMNVDPSTATEQDYSRYYNIPEHIGADVVEKMGITAPTHANPIILSLFGHIMNTTRNNLAASLFFMRAYAIAPSDRLNTLSLGIALLHAAMQRRSDNRHLQIMQGMMFVLEYVKLTGYNQEAEYNLGRAFHLIGLTHLAVPHYEKALCLPSAAMKGIVDEKSIDEVYTWPVEDDFEGNEEEEEDPTDLKREAAYNLHLIYATSGSMSLAQILLLKYCSI